MGQQSRTRNTLRSILHSIGVKKTTGKTPLKAQIIPRDEHSLSRKMMSENALKVLYRLKNQGFDGYLVGGGVRDLLLGREPKDFDIATNARPNDLRKCFKNGRIIGKRFRLVHVLFRDEIIEVSTFRANASPWKKLKSRHGIMLSDNIYGTLEEDASRRDFTINTLYYNIKDFSIVDFHDGLSDLKQGLLRTIGDPSKSFREDPIRMLRLIRLAAKLGFNIEKTSEQALAKRGHLIGAVSPARLFSEIFKLLLGGMSLKSYQLLRHYKLFGFLFPLAEECLNNESYEITHQLLTNALHDTDKRLADGKTVSPGFLFAIMLWQPLQVAIQSNMSQGLNKTDAFFSAVRSIIQEQQKSILLPGILSTKIRSIWEFQLRLTNRKQQNVSELLDHTYFRAGYDFLLLRARSGEDVGELSEWWTKLYNADYDTRKQIIEKLAPKRKSFRKRRKPKTKQ